MLTNEDLDQIAKLINSSEKRLTGKLETVDLKVEATEKRLTEKIESVDLKVEAMHEFNKKAHSEIIDLLVESDETNYHELKKELKGLKKRVEQLETKHQN